MPAPAGDHRLHPARDKGSPTMRSRPLTTTEQWLRDRGLTMADVNSKRSRRKKTAVPEGQMSFLDALPRVA